jgi:hypothetical protein
MEKELREFTDQDREEMWRDPEKPLTTIIFKSNKIKKSFEDKKEYNKRCLELFKK